MECHTRKIYNYSILTQSLKKSRLKKKQVAYSLNDAQRYEIILPILVGSIAQLAERRSRNKKMRVWVPLDTTDFSLFSALSEWYESGFSKLGLTWNSEEISQ